MSPTYAEVESTDNQSSNAGAIAEELSTLQGDIMRENDVLAYEQMQIANIERNIEENRISNERRAQELANTTDPQHRSYLQGLIDTWNRWAQESAYPELNERNMRVMNAQTNILNLQNKIANSETALATSVQNTLNDPNASNEEKVAILESYNRALESSAQARLHEGQKQIFLMVALQRQTEMMSTGNTLRNSMIEASKSLENAANKASEVYISQNLVIENQKAIIKALQTQEVTTEETIEIARDTHETLIESIEDIKTSIIERNSALDKLRQLLATLDQSSSNLNDVIESIAILENLIKESEAKLKDLYELKLTNDGMVSEIREDTLIERTKASLEVAIDGNDSLKGGLKVKKLKGDRFIGKLELPETEDDFLKLENSELREVEVIAKSRNRQIGIDLSIKNDNLRLIFERRPRNGLYEVQIFNEETGESASIEITVQIQNKN